MKYTVNRISSWGLRTCRRYLGVWLFLSLLGHAHSQDTTVTVVSNMKGAPTSLSLPELRSILKGEKQRWNDKENTKVVIVMLKTTTPIGKNICSKVYGMSADKVRRFYAEQEFVGRINGRITCNSVEELITSVAENPGAIGIIDKFSESPNIKVTTINGKKSF